jgi:hypothetical protein
VGTHLYSVIFSLNINVNNIICGPKLLKEISYIKGRNEVLGIKQVVSNLNRCGAGLITLRSLDRDESPVSFQFGSFTETVCHS